MLSATDFAVSCRKACRHAQCFLRGVTGGAIIVHAWQQRGKLWVPSILGVILPELLFARAPEPLVVSLVLTLPRASRCAPCIVPCFFPPSFLLIAALSDARRRRHGGLLNQHPGSSVTRSRRWWSDGAHRQLALP